MRNPNLWVGDFKQWSKYNLRWYMTIMLMFATTICYLDRLAMSYAAIPIKTEFGMTNEQFADITIYYTIAYGVMMPFAGRFMDWIKLRRGFIISIITWSCVSMAHAFGTGIGSFKFLRALLGITESGNFPGAAKAVSEWFPPKERAFATGVFNCGAGLGAILAPLVVGVLILKFGWREAFLATGLFGFIWAIGWARIYWSPAKHPKITQEELALIHSGAEIQDDPDFDAEEITKTDTKWWQFFRSDVWRNILSKRNFWALAVARMLSDPAWGLYTYWIPLYFLQARGFDLKQIVIFSWMPHVAADIGSLVGGALSSYFVKKGFNVITARKIAMCIFASLMPSALLAVRAESPYVCLAFLCVGAFGHQSWAASVLTLPADLFPKRVVGGASGLTAPLSTIASIFLLKYTGYMFDKGAFVTLFTLVGLMHPTAALWIVFMLKAKKKGTPKDSLVTASS